MMESPDVAYHGNPHPTRLELISLTQEPVPASHARVYVCGACGQLGCGTHPQSAFVAAWRAPDGRIAKRLYLVSWDLMADRDFAVTEWLLQVVRRDELDLIEGMAAGQPMKPHRKLSAREVSV